MKKSIKTKEVVETKKEDNLTPAFVLWRNKSKSGNFYLSGTTSEELEPTKLVGFFNTNKENPEAPDIRVFTTDKDGKQDKEVCTLWEHISKTEKRYLTGLTDEIEKIIAFYGEEHQEMRPYIRAYFKEEQK